AVRWWSVGCLLFERGGTPGIGDRGLTGSHAAEHVDEEQYLGQRYKDCCQRDVFVQGLGRRWNEIGAAHRVVAAWHTQKTEIVHRQIDGIGAEEGTPEVQLAQSFIHHAASHLGI